MQYTQWQGQLEVKLGIKRTKKKQRKGKENRTTTKLRKQIKEARQQVARIGNQIHRG